MKKNCLNSRGMISLATDLISMAVAATEAAAEMIALVDGILMFEGMAAEKFLSFGELFFRRLDQWGLMRFKRARGTSTIKIKNQGKMKLSTGTTNG